MIYHQIQKTRFRSLSDFSFYHRNNDYDDSSYIMLCIPIPVVSWFSSSSFNVVTVESVSEMQQLSSIIFDTITHH